MQRKWDKVLTQFKQFEYCLIAYSGGTDSTLLLEAAVQADSHALAVTARGNIFPEKEVSHAEMTAKTMGIPHLFVDFPILEVSQFSLNPKDRCYVCKKKLLGLMQQVAEEQGCTHIVEGTNLDDLADYRPGLQALTEEGIISPLKEAGLTKEEIRLLARQFGLPVRPSSPCLASRIPYDEPITLLKLSRIEKGEAFLDSLGFTPNRVRCHGELARIEVPPADVERLVSQANRNAIVEYFEVLGFAYTAMDLRGFVSGSLNKILNLNKHE